MMSFDIREHGATPGETSVNTSAIQAAIDAAGQTGGRVTVPPGLWRTGTIELRSNVELHVAAGATLMGTGDVSDYPESFPEDKVQTRRPFTRRLIYANHCRNVAITGRGTIDGNHGCVDDLPQGEIQPLNLHFVGCHGVAVRDVQLKHSGTWMQQYFRCEEVHISGIRVWNHNRRTNDGLDIDGSCEVRISDCDIDSRDDALVFKNTGPYPCRNITVTNCRLRSNCHGIKFGTESIAGFENITISNCVISPSRHPEPMPGFPEGRPVITGCALECTDGGTMRAIHIDGLIVERVFAPIFIKLGDRWDRRLPDDNPDHGCLEDITIRNVTARQAGPFSCSITGYPGHPVRRVHVENVRIEHRGGVEADAVLDEVPENSGAYPEMNMLGNKKGKHLPSYGFFVRHVDGLTMRDVDIRLLGEDARRPIVSEDISNAIFENVTGV